MANIPRPHFEDFEPVSELKSEKERDTLLLHLPGFKKEELKVQLTSTRFLRISGETSIGDNRWKRFRKDYQLPSNIDLEKISSKFSDGILYVWQPKLQTPELTEKEDQREKSAAEALQTPELTEKEHQRGKTAEEAVKPKVVQEQPPELQTQMPKQEASSERKDDAEKTESEAPTLNPQGHELEPASQPQILQQEASSERKKTENKDNMKDEEKKGKIELEDEVKKQVQSRPENLRRLAVYVSVFLIMLGFIVTKKFRSFTNKVEEQSVMGYDHQEL